MATRRTWILRPSRRLTSSPARLKSLVRLLAVVLLLWWWSSDACCELTSFWSADAVTRRRADQGGLRFLSEVLATF